jgi:hypothetical protein
MRSLLHVLLFCPLILVAQEDWRVVVEPINWELPGLHTYSIGQVGNHWLIVGGRRDGIHGVTPPQSYTPWDRNMSFFVLNTENGQVLEAPIPEVWPVELREHLSAASHQFAQRNNKLYITGGYGFRTLSGNKNTFPTLSVVDLPSTIDALLTGSELPQPKYINDEAMAVTGGRMLLLDNKFYLVGGHRFSGGYNATNQPTFQQTYHTRAVRFDVTLTPDTISVDELEVVFEDAAHLRRRDYNLVPQIFADGSKGMTVFSGVFKPLIDRPFLYPVDITPTEMTPHQDVEQLLSHYHSAVVPMFDASSNTMHNLFLGGMAEYYMANDVLVHDTLVPFVNSISVMTRSNTGTLTEWSIKDTLPALIGTGAEWIPSPGLPMLDGGYIVQFDQLNLSNEQEVELGYIVGGIKSAYGNPWSNNDIGSTEASSVYRVKLKKIMESGLNIIPKRSNGLNSVSVFPNPVRHGAVVLSVDALVADSMMWKISDQSGRVLLQGETEVVVGKNTTTLKVDALQVGTYLISVQLRGQEPQGVWLFNGE